MPPGGSNRRCGIETIPLCEFSSSPAPSSCPGPMYRDSYASRYIFSPPAAGTDRKTQVTGVGRQGQEELGQRWTCAGDWHAPVYQRVTPYSASAIHIPLQQRIQSLADHSISEYHLCQSKAIFSILTCQATHHTQHVPCTQRPRKGWPDRTQLVPRCVPRRQHISARANQPSSNVLCPTTTTQASQPQPARPLLLCLHHTPPLLHQCPDQETDRPKHGCRYGVCCRWSGASACGDV